MGKLFSFIGSGLIMILSGYILYQLLYPFSQIKEHGYAEWAFIAIFIIILILMIKKIIGLIKKKDTKTEVAKIEPVQKIEEVLPKPKEKLTADELTAMLKQTTEPTPKPIIKQPQKIDPFQGLLGKSNAMDISTMGARLADDFARTVDSMVNQLDNDIERLKQERTRAHTVWNNIRSTAEKLWNVNATLENTISRLDTMIQTNEQMKVNLEGIKNEN